MPRAIAARELSARLVARAAAATLCAALVAQVEPRFASGTCAELQARAAHAQQPLIVDLSTDACLPCRRLLQETWRDAALWAAIGDRALCARVDPEQDAAAAAFEPTAYPTVVVLAPNGAEVGRVVGFCGAAELRAQLERLLDPASAQPLERMRRGDQQRTAGDRAAAFAEYLWCWDHGLAHDPAFAVARVTQLSARLRGLVREYEPARLAVERRRDALERACASADVAFDALADLLTLTDALQLPAGSLAVLDRVPRERWQALRDTCGVLLNVLPVLVERHRYADALCLCGDPLRRFDLEIERLRRLMPDDGDVRRDFVHRLVGEQAAVVEALFGTDTDQTAGELFDRLLRAQPGLGTWMLALRAAAAAGREDAVRAYAEHALRALPAGDQAPAREFLARAPKK